MYTKTLTFGHKNVGYELSDITEMEITDDMIAEAEAEQKYLDDNKTGAKTVRTKANQNIIGSLAHQIVENKFAEFGFPFQSFRQERYTAGDQLDLAYENDRIDVKGIEGELNERYYFNEKCYIFHHQFINPKFLTLTHLCFCKIAPDYSRGWILGLISIRDFLAAEKENNYFDPPSHEIPSRLLKGFNRYILRVP
jgi:hypothetical protein